ncbi:conserved hypothetical protein [Wolbachia endosymbiont of Drosophila melanogaster]|uniref:Type II toxin-antitoxin system RelE/ParE family toxin n=1 Tax=Wolbachia pipientis TaxID=955 RepID=A0A6I6CNB7_WOLPI|nr:MULTISPECIES: type II toxin-antitoxin system RelE/ParE family toxin [Wolbachia]MBS9528866.1 type II toxin-antitoxin system RelE/ParE family toxin [Wolbachia endosymbiont of Ceratitis capitata]MDU8940711.1 type II toxin-antitoxin system RelE/ParE family toxin [Wolbachia endosymbiont of Drosophila malagassya]MDX5487778.1 type II toxin-antitoxin system RelE/ParE family toxin [Wolbachia endosymbiont of Andrena praecox]MDX5498283.1 type II toxin-antitoxin system RelE/ParE family toxin [Wolbachia 
MGIIYQIGYLEGVDTEDLPSLPKTIRLRVQKAIEKRLTIIPDKVGEALSHKWVGYFRLRVGDYRVIYLIDNSEHMVKIAAIGHRKEIYKRSPE